MKRLILLLPLLTLFACQDEIEYEVEEKNKNSNHEIVCYFPPMPSFPGGEVSLRTYIAKNLKYPKQYTEGRVYIQFTVNENGSISDADVVKGLCESCDKNALELFSKMPKWIPAERQGKPIKVSMIYPVKFEL